MIDYVPSEVPGAAPDGPPFLPYPKIPRLSRECVVTEKIDGTNAQIYISADGTVRAGSRTRWLAPGKRTDNFGFAGWVAEHEDELRALGPGRHFGEWWGQGIQRGYGLSEKRFSLFHTARIESKPAIVGVVPELFRGTFCTAMIDAILETLRRSGSVAAPGFMKPEGLVAWHTASGTLYKRTCEGDEKPKGEQS